jgi:uncharacterized protein with von Willebrand factor type A (vWA) domain
MHGAREVYYVIVTALPEARSCPRVVTLCDVSMSTRNMSRFWLHMVHQMQSLFSKIRTFVADVAEVTSLNHRTTLVILGDGRNNGKAPNAEALEEISHHVRWMIWITPEPKWGWSLGSCDMPLYEPLCDRVEVVRSVDQLAGVAEELVRARV